MCVSFVQESEPMQVDSDGGSLCNQTLTRFDKRDRSERCPTAKLSKEQPLISFVMYSCFLRDVFNNEKHCSRTSEIEVSSFSSKNQLAQDRARCVDRC